MVQKTAWKDFVSLPPGARKQVMDLIVFLCQQYGSTISRQSCKSTSRAKEGFVGMWRDREDLKDSSEWVRNARQREW